MTTSFACNTCGQTHEGLPTDRAFTLPDEVWAIPEGERPAQARWNEDLCQFGERCFIRCILHIPFQSQPGNYGWGVWVEVPEKDFYRYIELYSADGRGEPPFGGSLANDLPYYGHTLGLPVLVQLRTASDRPTVLTEESTGHPLAMEQARGMSNERYHEILVATGSVGGP